MGFLMPIDGHYSGNTWISIVHGLILLMPIHGHFSGEAVLGPAFTPGRRAWISDPVSPVHRAPAR
jgi:hypothetical protein